MHVAVLLDEVLRLLDPRPDARVLDVTGGAGGHARALGERLGPDGVLVVMDRDPDAVARIRARLDGLEARVHLVQDDFRNVDRVLADLGLDRVDAIVADLGVSTFQLEDARRGFSFQKLGPVDMRFDPGRGKSAQHWVNRAGREALQRIIAEYGEERFAGRVADAIVASRPIKDTITLAEVVRRAIPRTSHRIDPATRTFQALRIAANDELGALETFLEKGIEALDEGGRMAVIAFHSLEDRRVKTAFRGAVSAGRVSLLTRRPVRPERAETIDNPHARSAKLRGVERKTPDEKRHPSRGPRPEESQS